MMLVFAGMLFSTIAFPREVLSGKVVTVIDGNTVEVLANDNETYKIMLHGIDCPELNQEYGDAAKRYLERLLDGREVTMEVVGKNRYGVRQAIIMIEDLDPRFELLKAGLAWTSETNPIPELEAVKEKARDKGKGLWKEDDPTPPWIYRRQQTRLQFKSS